MQEQILKITDVTTPQDRERHMQEDAKMMHNNMHMMRGMMGRDTKGEKMENAKKAY